MIKNITYFVCGLLSHYTVICAANTDNHPSEPNSYVGKEFILKKEMKLRGVKIDLRSSKPDYFIVVGTPGVSGPEIMNMGILPIGTRIKIMELVKRRRFLSSSREYEAIIISSSAAEGQRVRIPNRHGLGLYKRESNSLLEPALSCDYFGLLHGT